MFAPHAEIEARMDSKLVVEQMSGRWKIKHPDMKPLALEANRLAPFGTAFTWVPREENQHADRLANEALDGLRSGVTYFGDGPEEAQGRVPGDEGADSAQEAAQEASSGIGFRGWSPETDVRTTLVLVRHGATPLTTDKRFSGGLAGTNPGLSDEGRAQVRATAEWLAPLAERVDALVTSPVRRTRESAEILADRLGVPVEDEPGFAEMEFGGWDGMTFTEVAESRKPELDAWLGSLDVVPGAEGESFRTVEKRVLAALDRLLAERAGQTVIVVSHVTPIKMMVAHALRAPLESVFRMELTPASVTVLTFFGGGPEPDAPMASMRLYNAQPPGRDQLRRATGLVARSDFFNHDIQPGAGAGRLAYLDLPAEVAEEVGQRLRPAGDATAPRGGPGSAGPWWLC